MANIDLSSHSGDWSNVKHIYGVGFHTDLDVSQGVNTIITRLKDKNLKIEVGNNLDNQFYLPPLCYCFVNNKTINNRYPTEEEPEKLSALTECELTFYANADNTLRMRYFIQVTHGQLIHGVSWIKSDHSIVYHEKEFKPIKELIYEPLIKNAGTETPQKEKYGIWDGQRHCIGKMYNYIVDGFNEINGLNEDCIDEIVKLMADAARFFQNNQNELNKLINNNK